MTVHARVLSVSIEGMRACSGARAMAYAHGARDCITRSAHSSAQGGRRSRKRRATRQGSTREAAKCLRARKAPGQPQQDTIGV